MLLEQHYLACLSQASYLIADPAAGVAAVVDPRRDVDVYLDRARALGVEIRHVLLTHFHADFVSGHLELQERTGATIHLGRAGRAEYAHSPLADGERIELGSVRVVALETPGHTPESVTYLVYDLARDAAHPHAALTGDTLFIGDVGRPDLMASVGVTADALARMLFHSLREKLWPLPDATLVYPGHGAGSLCGKSLSKETVSTIGAQRAVNLAFATADEAAFVALVTAGQPEAPAYFGHDARLNRRERETLDAALARGVVPLAPEDVLRRVNAGAQLVDVRDADAFAAGHAPGSVNVGLEGRFASWAGAVLDLERPIVLVAPPGKEREAAVRLARVGLDRIVGYLDGGPAALPRLAPALARWPRFDAAELERRLADDAPPLVLDVRAEGEWEAGHLAGALHVPLTELARRAGEVPRDRPLAIVCGSGYRSSIAASLLERRGYARLADLAGGMAAWNARQGGSAACPA